MSVYIWFLLSALLFGAMDITSKKFDWEMVFSHLPGQTVKWSNAAIASGLLSFLLFWLQDDFVISHVSYLCLGSVIGFVCEPRGILYKSIVQIFPTLLFPAALWYVAVCIAIQMEQSVLAPTPGVVAGIFVGHYFLKEKISYPVDSY